MPERPTPMELQPAQQAAVGTLINRYRRVLEHEFLDAPLGFQIQVMDEPMIGSRQEYINLTGHEPDHIAAGILEGIARGVMNVTRTGETLHMQYIPEGQVHPDFQVSVSSQNAVSAYAANPHTLYGQLLTLFDVTERGVFVMDKDAQTSIRGLIRSLEFFDRTGKSRPQPLRRPGDK